jgi:hypothetical protein
MDPGDDDDGDYHLEVTDSDKKFFAEQAAARAQAAAAAAEGAAAAAPERAAAAAAAAEVRRQCDLMYPVWATLRPQEKDLFYQYDSSRKKRIEKHKPVFEKRNYAMEHLINVFFNVDDGFIPDNRCVAECSSGDPHVRANWKSFLAALRSNPAVGQQAINSMKCPITIDFMVNPMLLPSGHSVEQSALQQWIAQNGGLLNPVTGARENLKEVKLNVPLKTFISAYNLIDVPAAKYSFDPANDLAGGKPRKITRHRRRHKMKRTAKKRHSKKSKRVQK